MTAQGDLFHGLAETLRAVRAVVAETAYPLPLDSAATARATAAELLHRLDAQVLPWLAKPSAPLLAVVGGATGAGRSTLVNSLVRAPVSPVGVIRPTTRNPVLVCHPSDLSWFRGERRLVEQGAPLELISAPGLSPGLAYLDAPDLDSVVERHRRLSDRLTAVADLWLFVTTAARYADAVPWRLLHRVRERGTTVAIVLDRVPAAAVAAVTEDLSGMLAARGPAGVPLFVVPEARVDGQGLLAEPAIGPLRDWLGELAADERARAGVVSGVLEGALDSLPAAVESLAAAAEQQVAAAETLAEQVGLGYGAARSTIERGVRAGTLLHEDDLVGWQPPTGSGRWADRLRESVRNLRARVTARRGPDPLPAMLRRGLVTLLWGAVTDAADQVGTAWRLQPAGAALLADNASGPATRADVGELVDQWRDRVAELAGHRAGLSTLVTVGVLGGPAVDATDGQAVDATGDPAVDPPGPAMGPPGGAVVDALDGRAVDAPGGRAGGAVGPPAGIARSLDEPQVRGLIETARADLLERCRQLLDGEAAHWLSRLSGIPLDGQRAGQLRAAVSGLAAVWRTGTGAAAPAGPAARPPAPDPAHPGADPAGADLVRPRSPEVAVPGTPGAPVPESPAVAEGTTGAAAGGGRAR